MPSRRSLRTACETAIADADGKRLVLDVRGVTFADFLNLLLTLSSACGLRLTGPLLRLLVRLDGHGSAPCTPRPSAAERRG